MILLPAIDLMNGKVVRLRQGKAEESTVYSEHPVEVALRFQTQGAQWLHLVDLDGAFSGVPANLDTVKTITETLSIPCELGGGLRDEKSITAAFEAGVKRVVLGTRVADSMAFVSAMAEQFGSERIAVGIDAKDGKVAVKGWTETTTQDALSLAHDASLAGAGTVIYTDISTDGMLQGPNLPAIKAMVERVDAQVIASGGVSNLSDLKALLEIPKLYGTIIGKALYEGRVDLVEALKISQ